MKIIFNIKYLLTVFCLLNTNFAYSTSILAPLGTYDEKLAFLLHVYKEIPNLFEDSGIYDVNLFTVLDNEVELVELLKQDPRFEELYLDKKYLNISVKPTADIWVGEVKIKLEAIEKWKNSILQKIEIAKNDFLTPDALLKGINTKEILDIDPSETFNEIKFIKINKKDKLIDEEQNNQFAICKRIPEMIKKFQCIKNNYDKINKLQDLPSIEKIDSIIAGITHEEKVFLQLYLAAVLKKNTNAPTPVNWEEFANSIAQLNGEDLIYFNDKNDVLKPILATYFDKENEPRFLRALNLIHNKEIKKYASDTISKQTKVTSEVELMEVPPQIGIFRGSVGGDCSTQFSFPYPNDPHERVFYIKTKKLGRVYKGYVSATEVMVGAEKALYVITISGAHVSAQDVELIFRGFEKAKDTLGVKHIILPTLDNLAGLINFPAIKAAYENHIKKSNDSVELVYQDKEIRDVIEQYKPDSGYNQGTYDYSYKNKNGIVLSITNNPVNVIINKQVIPQNNSHSNEDLFDFIKNLSAFKNKEIDRLLQSETIKKAFGEEGKTIIDNLFLLLDSCGSSDVSRVQQFKKKINNTLISLGLDKNYLDSNPDLMVPGYFKCQDAFFNNNLEEAAMLIAENIKIHQDESSLFTLIKDHSVNLNTTSAFKKLNKRYYEKLSNHNANTREIAIKIFENTMPTDPEIHRALVKALSDNNNSVKSAAARALGAIKPADPEIHRALVKALSDDDISVKSAAAWALGEIKSADPEIHKTLAKALEALVKALSDGNSLISENAAWALREIKSTDPEIHRALVRALGDDKKFVRRAAAEALGAIRPTDPQIHRALAQVLSDDKASVRKAAAEALGAIKPTDPEIHEALVQALSDYKHFFVRKAAAKALGAIKPTDPKVHRALGQALNDNDYDVQKIAAEALKAIKPTDPEFYKALIKNLFIFKYNAIQFKDPSMEEFVISVQPTNNETMLEIAELLQDKNEYTNVKAIKYFSFVKPTDPEIHRALVVALGDNDRLVHDNAVDTLAKIKPTDLKVLKSIAQFLLDSSDVSLKKGAAWALREISPNQLEINRALVIALGDENGEVRKTAAQALEKIIFTNEIFNMTKEEAAKFYKALIAASEIDYSETSFLIYNISKRILDLLLTSANNDAIFEIANQLLSKNPVICSSASDIIAKINPVDQKTYFYVILSLWYDNGPDISQKTGFIIQDIKSNDEKKYFNFIWYLLNYNNDHIREKAVNMLIDIQPEYIKSLDNEMYFNFIWKLLNYNNDHIREKAIDMVEYVKPVDYKIYITFLWNMLKYGDDYVRQKAVDMFKLIKFEDINYAEHKVYFTCLGLLFKHDNTNFSDTATDILRKIKLQSSNFYPNLIKNLTNNDCSVRQKNADLIIKITPEDPEILNEIEKLLNHENDEIVALAKDIIMKIKPTDVVEHR
jgi:HEAT repeat protein